MFTLYLTPASVSYLVQSILALTITGYFFYRLRSLSAAKNRTHAFSLTCFFACVSLFSLMLFFEASLPRGIGFFALYLQTVVMALGLVFLVQFTYHFPTYSSVYKWEARLALGLGLWYTLYETQLAFYRYILLSQGEVTYRPVHADYPMALSFLWVLVVFIRQSLRLSLDAAPSPKAFFLKYLWLPYGREANVTRSLGLVYSIPFALSLLNILRSSYIISGVVYNASLSAGILISLSAFTIVYLDYLPETTSFIIKLVTTMLVVVLSVLGMAGWVVAPIYAAQYQPRVPASHSAMRFTPNDRGGYTVAAIPYVFETDLGERLPDDPTGDRWGQDVDVGFVFPFYGRTYSHIYPTPGGALAISQNVSYSIMNYHAGGKEALIFPLFTNFDPTISGGVFVRREAERLLVTWQRAVVLNRPNDFYTFQVALYPDGIFEIFYADFPLSFDFAPNQDPGASPWLVGAVPPGLDYTPLPADFSRLPLEGTSDGLLQDYQLDFRCFLDQLMLPLAYLVLGCSLLVIVLFPLLLHFSLVQPLDVLLKGVQQMNAGNYQVQLNVQHSDEIGFLTQSFNDMSQQLGGLIQDLEGRVAERTLELKENQRTMSTLLANLPGMAYRRRNDDRWTMEFVSAGCFDLTGCYESELVGNVQCVYFELIHPADRQLVRNTVDAAVQSGQPFQITYRLITCQGIEKWVWEQGQGVVSGADGAYVVEGFITDITQRKCSEDALQESESRLRQSISALRQAVWLRDIATQKILYVNPAYETIWGHSCESFYADSFSFLKAVHADDKERVAQAVRKQYEGVHFDEEYRILRPDGEVRRIWGQAFTITNAEGLPTRILAVAEDITDRRHMEEVLRQAKETAEAANRAKSAFLAHMSHELRTPLNAILGFSELLSQDASFSAAQLENIETINRSGEHLLGLINSVLEISKIESGQITLQIGAFDLHRLLQDLEKMFALRARQKGVILRIDYSPEVPRQIYGDHGKLRQVLINLLGNAIKFTDSGTILLAVDVSLPDALPVESAVLAAGISHSVNALSSVMLHFIVEDTGVGVATDELGKIFDAFYQSENGQHVQQGSGLGLTISRQYIELMGGHLDVTSEVGVGSNFCFDLPVQPVSPLQESIAQLPRRVIGLEPGQPTYRLLIVEDVESSQRLLLKLLQPLGFELRLANNGAQALEIWQQWQPHLIFMDLRMPVMSGEEAIRRIKATPQGQETIIIALTASVFEEERSSVVELGCSDFIRKPYRQRQIFKVLSRYLGVRFLYAEPQSESSASPAQLLPDYQPAELPEKWKRDLHQALLGGDINAIYALSEEIRSTHIALASKIEELAYSFNYEGIRNLLDGQRRLS